LVEACIKQANNDRYTVEVVELACILIGCFLKEREVDLMGHGL
jgi:hypothetical protein